MFHPKPKVLQHYLSFFKNFDYNPRNERLEIYYGGIHICTLSYQKDKFKVVFEIDGKTDLYDIEPLYKKREAIPMLKKALESLNDLSRFESLVSFKKQLESFTPIFSYSDGIICLLQDTYRVNLKLNLEFIELEINGYGYASSKNITTFEEFKEEYDKIKTIPKSEIYKKIIEITGIFFISTFFNSFNVSYCLHFFDHTTIYLLNDMQEILNKAREISKLDFAKICRRQFFD